MGFAGGGGVVCFRFPSLAPAQPVQVRDLLHDLTSARLRVRGQRGATGFPGARRAERARWALIVVRSGRRSGVPAGRAGARLPHDPTAREGAPGCAGGVARSRGAEAPAPRGAPGAAGEGRAGGGAPWRAAGRGGRGASGRWADGGRRRAAGAAGPAGGGGGAAAGAAGAGAGAGAEAPARPRACAPAADGTRGLGGSAAANVKFLGSPGRAAKKR